jgi:aminoglycoside phosphotransferase (APT) family kinase protein
MNAPVPLALGELEASFSIPLECVERSCLDRAGDVRLETLMGGQRRWFHRRGALHEVWPLDDGSLPLCAQLAADDLPFELLAWRPGRRIAVCRFGESGREFLKGVRPRRLAAVAEAFERVQDALGTAQDFLVPRVLQRSSETAALRTHWLEFEPIGVNERSEALYHDVGEALRRFQAAVPIRGLAHHGFSQELRVLDCLADSVRQALGVLPVGWLELRVRLGRAALPVTEDVAVHRDLHDGQLLTDGERVGLIDLDLLSAGSPVLDIANLTVHMVLRELQGRTEGSLSAAENCGRALMQGYGLEEGEAVHGEVRTYQAATFLRLALVYALRPRWDHLPHVLNRYAARCLEEL